MIRIFLLFLQLILTLLPALVYTQQELMLPQLNGPVKLDGLSDEPAWETIEPLPMTMYTPTFPGEPTERTEVRVAYDDRYIYVAGRLYESDPDGIQAHSLVRDLDRGGDFFNFLLDTYNDNETLLGFFTTPAGNRLDAEISNDAEGDSEADFFNVDWNGFWDCAVVQNGEGWFVEMRIPFSSLRFQDDDGEVVFGMMVHRLINRKNERVTFPPIPPKWEAGQWKASNAQDVRLTGVPSRNPFYLTPYVLGGTQQLHELNGSGAAFERHDEMKRELGFDLKYSLTKNFTLDLTANTDFAQVEADDELLNLTRFPLFFPEKRQFFQERSGIFSFKTGAVSRLFHSRRIGISDDGSPVRIFGGVRLVGRTGPWDVGFLNLQTDNSGVSPSENFGVLRLRRRTFNPYSYFGAMVTSRIGDDGSYNLASGLDGIIRVAKDDYLTVNLTQTSENESKSLLSSSLLRAQWARRSTKGLGYSFELLRVGDSYNPGVGFIERKNYTRIANDILYGYFFHERSSFYRHIPLLANTIFIGNTSGKIETALQEAKWKIDLKSGTYAYFVLSRHFERIARSFSLLNRIEIPADQYTFYRVNAFYGMSISKPLRTSLNFDAGSFYDGNQVSVMATPTWNQSRHLELSAEYEFNRLRFSQRHQSLDAHIVRWRILTALNIHFSTSGFIQYNSVENKVGVNLRFRYNFREGHDVYLVYNEALNTVRDRSAVSLPVSDSRQILFKYSYTFLW
ncbi:carbohydrate binding family 9 domain-containing protein [candidate division KSB1 bacterium]|nr:carbohydrate binding family 9 domain-containing protein [candidate division KSB1 bacterium]NIR69247.1 carbohydrate binding family 9 domain-containing protein [candidate division KSB1 bacterium]NIS27421.1 carbohydrate binding family 9 domain-containing protein [candidate division KSB1 bacterium]NIT74246.1 carbohydrate binding family 9 domain-containing protein [candidate division KSB1 bacterium]NIU28138.1 carbohydrate binding family 9 domain-containing protein [candidate division KSB1 bacteri